MKPLNRTAEQIHCLQRGATVFRVPVKPQPPECDFVETYNDPPHMQSPATVADFYKITSPKTEDSVMTIGCPFGTPGDSLYVRETWHYTGGNNVEPSPGYVSYRADGEFTVDKAAKWRPLTTMPAWASRYTLTVVSVLVERLQDVTEEDAVIEGFPLPDGMKARICITGLDGKTTKSLGKVWDMTALDGLKRYWNAQHPKQPWEQNPWVWRIEHKPVEAAK